MNYSWYKEYNSALSSNRAVLQITSCKTTSGNFSRIIANGEIEEQNKSGTVDVTEYLEYLKRNHPTEDFPSARSICKEKWRLPVWQYDSGLLTGRDLNKELESDSIRASRLYQNIKKWLFISTAVLVLGIVIIKVFID